MNETIMNFFHSLNLGDVQINENLAVVPVFQSKGKTLKYISLDSGIKKGLVEIKEVNSAGSVPDLLLINNSDDYVFVLHGEELLGAKQNRTVNTSILINKKSNVIIPVSCIERGRWNYVSDKFGSSDYIIPSELKKKSLFAANYSLSRKMGFRADQSEVWEEIDKLSAKAKVVSRTSALHDVQKKFEKNYDELTKNIRLLPEQKGVAVFINNNFQGLEFISRKSVFKAYYEKILKSYAFDAIMSDEKQPNIEPDYCLSVIREELELVKCKKWYDYKSIGLGFDSRCETEKSAGSILQVDNTVIYFNYFFRN